MNLPRIIRPLQLFNIAKNSNCLRLQVGAVGKDSKGNIYAGWNHMEDGSPCEINPELSKIDVVHGEIHVLRQSDDIVSIHVTHSPCLECAKHIVERGVTYVEYIEGYRLSDGIEYLKRMGVEVVQIKASAPLQKPIILNDI